jgi:hypothetical protein
MYLIGFLGSPLPYLLLVGMYLSGFAFLNLKAATRVSDEAIQSEPLIQVTNAVLPQNTNTNSPDHYILSNHQDSHSCLAFTSKGHDHVAFLTHNRFKQRHAVLWDKVPMINSGIIVLFHPSQNTIRPPPVG